jgi:hypothetical protein
MSRKEGNKMKLSVVCCAMGLLVSGIVGSVSAQEVVTDNTAMAEKGRSGFYIAPVVNYTGIISFGEDDEFLKGTVGYGGTIGYDFSQEMLGAFEVGVFYQQYPWDEGKFRSQVIREVEREIGGPIPPGVNIGVDLGGGLRAIDIFYGFALGAKKGKFDLYGTFAFDTVIVKESMDAIATLSLPGAATQSFTSNMETNTEVMWGLKVGLGVDYYLTNWLAVGAAGNFMYATQLFHSDPFDHSEVPDLLRYNFGGKVTVKF